MERLIHGIAQNRYGQTMVTVMACPVTFQSARPSAQHFDLYRDTRIFLDGEINGRATPMLLDSGASVTVVDRAFAATLGLKGGTPIGVQGAGVSERGELYRGIAIDAGNLSFKGLTVAAMDLSLVEKALGRRVPVVLGREAFMSSAWEGSCCSSAAATAERSSAVTPIRSNVITTSRFPLESSMAKALANRSCSVPSAGSFRLA